MSEQLDLLDWVPPTASVLAFPQRRNVGRVRRVAALIEKRRSDESRQKCFDKELWALCQLLKAHGLPEQVVDRQLDEFTAAVNAELWRREARRRPGGRA